MALLTKMQFLQVSYDSCIGIRMGVTMHHLIVQDFGSIHSSRYDYHR